MKVLITGTNGFIGKTLYENLSKVFEIDSLNKTFNNESNDPSSIVCDLSLEEDLNKIHKKYDLVIHLAAYSKVEDITFKDSVYEQVNFLGTKNLLKKIISNGTKKIIFISSSNVYEKSQGALSESSNLNATNSYEQSKKLCEELLYEHKDKIQTCILRIPLVYGKRSKSFLKSLNSLILLNIPLPFLGFEKKRSYISLQNLVSVINFFANKDWRGLDSFNVFNCSDDHDMSFSELIYFLGSEQSKKTKLFYLNPLFLKFLFHLIKMDKQFEFIDMHSN